jgi:hypothetical protein
VALAFVCVSRLFRGIFSSLIYGDNSPNRAFQSPHITEFVFPGIFPMMSSIKLLASSSFVPRFYIFYTGGKYTFPIHILSPPYTYIHVLCAYSLPVYLITFIPRLTSIAIPPLLPLFRRYSNT